MSPAALVLFDLALERWASETSTAPVPTAPPVFVKDGEVTQAGMRLVVRMCGDADPDARRLAWQAWQELEDAELMLGACDGLEVKTLTWAASDLARTWLEKVRREVPEHNAHADILWCAEHLAEGGLTKEAVEQRWPWDQVARMRPTGGLGILSVASSPNPAEAA